MTHWHNICEHGRLGVLVSRWSRLNPPISSLLPTYIHGFGFGLGGLWQANSTSQAQYCRTIFSYRLILISLVQCKEQTVFHFSTLDQYQGSQLVHIKEEVKKINLFIFFLSCIGYRYFTLQVLSPINRCGFYSMMSYSTAGSLSIESLLTAAERLALWWVIFPRIALISSSSLPVSLLHENDIG